jgi:D-alanyl-D-alanine carboxypeptidase/D-alanyl-D-alanine-endopeptidase (penicillin-binding protein 4)
MPEHKVIRKPKAGKAVAVWESAGIRTLTKSMIKYSTNMTAETLGMNASAKRGITMRSLRGSAQAMTKWLEATYGVRGAKFVDHSGLGSNSRISAHEMARLLVNAKWDGILRPIMKEITLRNSKWQNAPIAGAKIAVKTGTLNFASALAGYVTCPNGRKLAFAIFTADMKKRAAIAKKDRERPVGTKTWARKSRIMQHQLIRHWIQAYGT